MDKEQRLGILDSIPLGILEIDLDGEILAANPACLSILGYRDRELIGLSIFDEIFNSEESFTNTSSADAKPDSEHGSLRSFVATIQEAQPSPPPPYYTTRHTSTGDKIELQMNWNYRRDGEGNLVGFVSAVSDVTEQSQTRERLAKNLAEAERVARLVKLGTYEWDWQRNSLVACSEEYARMCELTVEETLRKFTSTEVELSYIHPDDRERYTRLEAEAVAIGKPQSYTIQYRLLLPSGRIFHVREVFDTVFNEQGELISMTGCLQDVTEQVQLEEQLRQAQKMEVIGQLAGSIAHDFNNLLTGVAGYSDVLLDNLSPNDPMHHLAAEIKKAADRAATLTRQLLAFGRKQILKTRVVDLSEIARDMEDLLQQLIGNHIKLRVGGDPDPGMVMADPGQIEQVFMNLVVNAADAMPLGGEVMVSIENVSLDDRACSEFNDLRAGDYVLISVADSGTGMSEATLSHIFEPFFTTKSPDKGTGLGLSTVFGIVKQSGGDISVESEPGRGTSFHIYLPRVEVSKHAGEETTEHSSPIDGNETILIVEDDDAIRELLKLSLSNLGYTVLLASNGGEALQITQSHLQPIDLMITDLNMPQMTGHELVRQVTPMRPEMSYLYISGYDAETAANQGPIDLEKQFLQKPFSPRMIAEKIREALNNPDSTPRQS